VEKNTIVPTLAAADAWSKNVLIMKQNVITPMLYVKKNSQMRKKLLRLKIAGEAIIGRHKNTVARVNEIVSIVRHFISHELQWSAPDNPMIFISSFIRLSRSDAMLLIVVATNRNMLKTRKNGNMNTTIWLKISYS
jgi:hypothetical protein